MLVYSHMEPQHSYFVDAMMTFSTLTLGWQDAEMENCLLSLISKKMDGKGYLEVQNDGDPDMVIIVRFTDTEEYYEILITIGRFTCDCPLGISGIMWRGYARVSSSVIESSSADEDTSSGSGSSNVLRILPYMVSEALDDFPVDSGKGTTRAVVMNRGG